MRKNGFTLVELLAIIIILGVIALITVPIVTDLIDTGRKGTYVTSIEGLIDAVKIDVANNNFAKNRKYTLDSANGNLYLIETSTGVLAQRQKINVKGSVNGSASVVVNEQGDILIAAHNNEWCVRNSRLDSKLSLSNYNGNCAIQYNHDFGTETISFTHTPLELSTSKTVTINASTNIAQLQYKYISTSNEIITDWTNINNEDSFVVNQNGTVYGRYFDGENITEPATYSITTVDSTPPT